VKKIHKAILGFSFLGITSFGVVKIAHAWQSHEHMVTGAGSQNWVIPSNLNQAQADSWCRSTVYNNIDWQGGLMNDAAHNKLINFAKFSRPFVWGHLAQRRCVINATWGFIHY
jgi:hypothetical protein